jgi:hypothetical protein
MWKKIMENATNNSQPKLGLNVTMVQCDQPILDVLVTIRGQRARMPEEEPEERERLVLQEDNEPNGKEKRWFIEM